MARVSLLDFGVFLLYLHSAIQGIVNAEEEEDDIKCLRTFKSSLKDPQGYLSSWNFDNASERGFICNFAGVECWHPDENRVVNIRLPGMALEGDFPSGFEHCSKMTGLDLSDNKFSGTIPTGLSQWLPFLTSLDLSRNRLHGPIPAELANCSYLNVVYLQKNELSGQIPWQLSRLDRLKEFDVGNNRLSGEIPWFLVRFNASSFQNNTGLCGPPLQHCSSQDRGQIKLNPMLLLLVIISGCTVLVLVAFCVWWFILRSSRKPSIEADSQKWALATKHGKPVQVTTFEKYSMKIKLDDVLLATNGFKKDNIIGSGRTGTMYKATLANGSVLTVKRLKPSSQTEKQFKMEMNALGLLRHRNLVPLIGFCMVKDERLLLYKYMANGSLSEHVHAKETEPEYLDWIARLRIGVGAARGLAWLHHSCNPRIIHRNVSSSSILLDESFDAKITDFGLAKLMNPVDTHLSTFINGDFGDLGYVAPEYMSTLVATLKGDVYSFGVVLLELVTGQKPVAVKDAQTSFRGNLAEWVKHLSKKGLLFASIDKSLAGKGHDDEIMQVLKIACSCVVSTPKDRPSMYEVYQWLAAVAKRYSFSHQNEDIPFADADLPKELIVANA